MIVQLVLYVLRLNATLPTCSQEQFFLEKKQANYSSNILNLGFIDT